MLNGRWHLVIPCVVFVAALGSSAASIATAEQCLLSTIAFTSTRDYPAAPAAFASAEIYLMDPDGTNARRLTNDEFFDGYPKLSPDGKRIVFDSNRARGAQEPVNTSDLFLMKVDGKELTFLTRGSSATWSPDRKYIAFHRSASGVGLPINPNPGAGTTDSDLFVIRVPDDDPIEGPINVTNSPLDIEEDADWSPDGKKIVFTRHPATEQPSQRPFNYPSQEIYVLHLETGAVEQLTHNQVEERAPAWSPDGTRIAYMCRVGPLANGAPTFEICVMNADGTQQTRLTFNNLVDAGPTWSPEGQKIVFQSQVGPANQQIWVMDAADGTGQIQLTDTPANLFPAWGAVRAKCAKDENDDEDN